VEWSAEGNERGALLGEPKRHSVYADDARTILDMIHADTEKMIDEITRKYGDLDEPGIPASYSMPANLRNLGGLGSTGDSTPTGRTTQYYVYREFYQCERKVSLSDILQPEQFAASQRRLDEARFLETQRHSSASFFLTGQQSQESLSLLSDGDGPGSYCNSLESVLSDESDCQSAPLEYPQTQVAVVTGLKFTNDCRHLISASGDGCIFIWQVPHDMIVTMQARMSQQRLRSGHAPLPRPLAPISPPDGIVLESPTSEIEQPQLQPKFGVAERFSDVGQLPQWAMRKAAADSDSGALSIPTPSGGSATVPGMHAASSMGNLSSSPSQQMTGLAPRARGRWAQRSTQLETADDLRSNSESPLGTVSSVGGHSGVNVQTSDYNSASSKDITYNQTYLSEDSSIDSGMETRRGELKFIGSSNNGTVVTVSSVSSMAVSASNGAMSTGSGAAQQRLQLPDKRLKPGLRFDTHTHDHDGDVEDISDGERTSSDHGMFYNNLAPSTPTLVNSNE